MADIVEKLEKGVTTKFRGASAKTARQQSSALQRVYESRSLKNGTMMWPPTQFLQAEDRALARFRSPEASIGLSVQTGEAVEIAHKEILQHSTRWLHS